MRAVIALAALGAATFGLGGSALAQGMDMMQFADADQDGKVTQAEYATFMEQGWSFISQGAEAVKIADLDDMMKGAFVGIAPDAEGKVTKAVYLAAGPGRFTAADKDGDGTLSADELNGSMMPPS